MSIRKMIALHPDVQGHVNQPLGDAVHHLMYCAKMCLSCADACAAEKMDMRQCIRTCLDCADVCEAAAGWRCAGPARTRRSCAKCSSYARASAKPARRSARSTITSIAGCARRCAANARTIAGTPRRPSTPE